jgi:O-antigen/teichoic acid export membrane protein
MAMSIAQGFILLLWLMRQVCYSRGVPGVAAAASLGYLALMLGGLWIVHQMGGRSAACLGAMAASSLLAALWIGMQLGGAKVRSDDGPLWREIIAEHWRYGRWAMASGLIGSAPSVLTYLLLPLYANLAQSGTLRAMATIVMPAHLANAAASNLLLPQLVQRRGTRSFRQLVRLSAFILVLGPLAYWLALGLWHTRLIALVYGGRFVEDSNLLWLVGMLPVLGSGIVLGSSVLRAWERPSREFYATAIAGGSTIAMGAILLPRYGMWGAAWANVLNSIGIAVCLYVFVARTRFEGDAARDPRMMPLSETSTGECPPTRNETHMEEP